MWCAMIPHCKWDKSYGYQTGKGILVVPGGRSAHSSKNPYVGDHNTKKEKIHASSTGWLCSRIPASSSLKVSLGVGQPLLI